MDLLLIPEPHRAAATRALHAVFGTQPIESLALLSGGYSGALLYRVGVAARDTVLRIITRVDAFNDPVRQYACQNIAAAANIAPRVLYSDATDATSITDFVPAVPFSGSMEARLIELARTIRTIQATPLFPPLVDFLDGIDGFIANVRAAKLLPESATTPHFALYAHIQRAYPRHTSDLVSSHNDLNPNNLIFDGEKFWVIDWETAFANDRYVDLAAAFNFSHADDEAEEVYLRAYFAAAPTSYQRARFFLMRQICLMFYATVHFQIVSALKTPDLALDQSMKTPTLAQFYQSDVDFSSIEGKWLYAKTCLNQARAHMESARFAAAIKQMNA